MNSGREHIVWLDLMRLVAILMVVAVHCTDPFNVLPAARIDPSYNLWGSLYGSMLRPSVPLFVMITGMLLLPVTQTISQFYRKRILRVLFPFLIWSVLYNLFPWISQALGGTPQLVTRFFAYSGDAASPLLVDALKNIALIPFTFSAYTTHMWYVYLLIGVYLYLPIFSAWVERASDSAKRLFLLLWGVTLLLPYVQFYLSEYLFGTCAWNAFGTFYSFAGFSGYLLLGHYLGRGSKLSLVRTLLLAIPMFAIGYATTFIGFRHMVALPGATEPMVELFFTYCSLNVVLMSAAVFLVIQKVRISGDAFKRFLATTTRFGFGIYMVHYFWVGPAFGVVGLLNLPIPFQIPAATVLAFTGAWLMVWMLSQLPKSKYFLG